MKRQGTLSLSWGKNGGLYAVNASGVRRLCLGPVALTYWPWDIDELLGDLTSPPVAIESLLDDEDFEVLKIDDNGGEAHDAESN